MAGVPPDATNLFFSGYLARFPKDLPKFLDQCSEGIVLNQAQTGQVGVKIADIRQKDSSSSTFEDFQVGQHDAVFDWVQ